MMTGVSIRLVAEQSLIHVQDTELLELMAQLCDMIQTEGNCQLQRRLSNAGENLMGVVQSRRQPAASSLMDVAQRSTFLAAAASILGDEATQASAELPQPGEWLTVGVRELMNWLKPRSLAPGSAEPVATEGAHDSAAHDSAIRLGLRHQERCGAYSRVCAFWQAVVEPHLDVQDARRG